jgi:hypothetical protein
MPTACGGRLQSGRYPHVKKKVNRTHSIPLVCDTTGIHREVEELPPFWAPTGSKYLRVRVRNELGGRNKK